MSSVVPNACAVLESYGVDPDDGTRLLAARMTRGLSVRVEDPVVNPGAARGSHPVRVLAFRSRAAAHDWARGERDRRWASRRTSPENPGRVLAAELERAR